jgi:hypothetical protein
MRFNHFKSGGIVCTLMILISILSTSLLHAQGKASPVKGIVQDESGELLPGVSVILRNTKNNFTSGTVSDSSGVFGFSKNPARRTL